MVLEALPSASESKLQAADGTMGRSKGRVTPHAEVLTGQCFAYGYCGAQVPIPAGMDLGCMP